MIWDRERYIAHCRFEFTGREMFCELFGPLIGLEEEWRRQGASAKEIALTAFDWDYVLKTPLHGVCGPITGRESVVIEDTPEHTLSIDEMGRTMKLCKQSATIPLPLDHPVGGMDAVALRNKYGNRFCIKGGIDKFVLRKDFAAIDAELAYKMAAPLLGGGTVFAIDHRIPNGVPIENYRHYVRTGRELLGLPPAQAEGWARMAF